MSGLPFEGLTVLDLSRLLPGPFCSLLLADFGADVVKVEDTGMGDYVRWAPPFHEGVPESAKSAMFLALNRNKSSVRINLKEDAGKEVLLKLVAGADVVLESFRPGVLDRLGVGYERMREVNPGIVYCAITGYGQDGPLRDRSGHDMNYLGLIGLLGLTGDADGPPVQAAGQIADVGGGALMAAFGILAALRERDRSGEGQFVDISMADGALSWLAMPAGVTLAGGDMPRRGEVALGGRFVCYRPYAASDGWVSLGALEAKFWQAWCRGVGREDLIGGQFDGVGSVTHEAVKEIFAGRTREEWRAFASEYDCCLEPVLELDEVLESELVAAREMVVGLDQPGAERPVRLLGTPVKLSRTPADTNRRPGPELGEHTDELLRAAGYDDEAIAALHAAGAVGGVPAGAQGSFLGVNGDGLLKMSELAEASGVSAGTIKHYLREGLLGSGDDGVVRTSRNMAYYPPEFVERIQLIKRLQEERFMPLRLIRQVLDEDPGRAQAIVDTEDRIIERALERRGAQGERMALAEALERYGVPQDALDRLAELGILSPRDGGYERDDVAMIEALSRFRAGGYDESLGFTVYETLRYREALQPLVEEEVRVLLDRLAGEVDEDQAVEIIVAGTEPLRELIGAMHSKLLIAELRRQRGQRGTA